MEIIGAGDIASAIKQSGIDKDFLWFASGVSNSAETRVSEFSKEVDLLKKQDTSKHIVYFSTLSIYYKNSPYVQHKLNMERQIQWRFETYTIIRLGNITWGKNPNTIINFFKANPKAPILEGYRYLLDKYEFIHWLTMIPEESDIMNITGKLTYIPDIMKHIKEGKQC